MELSVDLSYYLVNNFDKKKPCSDARVKAPAEAEKYKAEVLAKANKMRAVLEAEAQAEAIALKGDAEAFSVEIKAKAEAEGMAKKADAFKEYGKAAKVVLISLKVKDDQCPVLCVRLISGWSPFPRWQQRWRPRCLSARGSPW